MIASVSNREDRILDLVLNRFSSTLILLLILNSANSQIHLNNYKLNLPDPLDNKTLHIAIDFNLSNVAAHLLPLESIMNGMATAAFSTSAYAVRYIAADYMREQNIATPNDLLQQCGAISLTSSFPTALTNYAAIKSAMPGSSAYAFALTGVYVAAKTSVYMIHCYSDYSVSVLVAGIARRASDYLKNVLIKFEDSKDEYFEPMDNYLCEFMAHEIENLTKISINGYFSQQDEL